MDPRREAPQAARVAGEIPGAGGIPPTVLLVDDEETSRALLRPVLRDHYRIVEAQSAAAALDVLAGGRIDLVLLDVVMPAMTGFEACKVIKERHRDPFLPVLLITGLTDLQQRRMGLQAGADDFLTKPVDPQELILRTRAFLRLRAQDALIRQQLRQLRRMEAARDELTSLMVHDLRAPLSGIVAHLQLLLDELPNGPGRQDAASALRDADSMFSTLEDALQVRLLEEGRLEIHRASVDVPALMKSAVATLEAVARRKNIAVDLRVQVDAREASLDEKLVRRAIENLLGNAVKYTPSGKDIAVVVRQAGGAVVIDVADRGPGVPAGMRDTMFEKFGSVEARKGGVREGIGLGLYMVKLVAEGHGGKVEILDREGGGALFRLKLGGGEEAGAPHGAAS
jgi:two-component system sensor histidine kinase/response regulator